MTLFPGRREILAEEQVQPAARGQRERGRIGDHRVAQQRGARAGARATDRRDRAAKHVPGGRNVLQEILDHGLHGHRLVALVPDVVVGHQRQRRVAELGFAGQLGFRHVGHADDVDAPAAVDARLGLRRELRPLDADVGAPAMDGGARRARGLLQRGRQRRADRIGHADVRHDAVAEERRHPAPGGVVELRGHDQVERVDRLLHAADGRHRDHPLGAERLEPPDVRAKVQLGRREAMTAAVARQEDHAPALVGAGAVLVRRVAERRPHAAPADVGQALELVEPAAADDADRRLAHPASVSSSMPRALSPRVSVTRTRAMRRRRCSGPGNATSI